MKNGVEDKTIGTLLVKATYPGEVQIKGDTSVWVRRLDGMLVQVDRITSVEFCHRVGELPKVRIEVVCPEIQVDFEGWGMTLRSLEAGEYGELRGESALLRQVLMSPSEGAETSDEEGGQDDVE